MHGESACPSALLCTVHRGAGRGLTRADACVQANSCDTAPEHTFLLLVKWTRKSDEEPELIKRGVINHHDLVHRVLLPSPSPAASWLSLRAGHAVCLIVRVQAVGNNSWRQREQA